MPFLYIASGRNAVSLAFLLLRALANFLVTSCNIKPTNIYLYVSPQIYYEAQNTNQINTVY